jgi:site-specific recombinase XerD
MTTGLRATARNRKQAEALEVKKREELSLSRRFNISPVENKTFAEAAEEFRMWMKAEHGRTLNTLEAYSAALDHCIDYFKGRMLMSVDSGDVENLKVHRLQQNAPATVVQAMLVLTKLFRYAKRRRWCVLDPTEGVTRPSTRESRRYRTLSYEEEKRFLAGASDDPNLHDLVVILLNHGLRPDEPLNLRKEDVNLEKRQFTVQQGKTAAARRTVHMTEETHAIFARRMENKSEWIFYAEKNPNEHLALNTIQCRQKSLREKLGIEFVLYDLRHSFATRVLEGGANPAIVAKLLGHVDLATVHRYIHPADEMLSDAMRVYEETRHAKLTAQHPPEPVNSPPSVPLPDQNLCHA